jgi:hypothetical protein
MVELNLQTRYCCLHDHSLSYLLSTKRPFFRPYFINQEDQDIFIEADFFVFPIICTVVYCRG